MTWYNCITGRLTKKLFLETTFFLHTPALFSISHWANQDGPDLDHALAFFLLKYHAVVFAATAGVVPRADVRRDRRPRLPGRPETKPTRRRAPEKYKKVSKHEHGQAAGARGEARREG